MYCNNGAGWSCNELGIHFAEGHITARDPEQSQSYFSRTYNLGFRAGCLNLLLPGSLARDVPAVTDLRAILREGKQNLVEMPEAELYARACEHGWTFACERDRDQ